jgi:hypothetical protein
MKLPVAKTFRALGICRLPEQGKTRWAIGSW